MDAKSRSPRQRRSGTVPRGPEYLFAPNEQQLKVDVEQASRSDEHLLLIGESGTGKTLLALHIHNHSKRKDGPFRSVNCGAIPDDLVESELFGYEKGAFTGATSQKVGLIRQADLGTLFLDEIDKASKAFRYKLLTFLQDRTYRPLGSTGLDSTADVRIICASQSTSEDIHDLLGDALMRRLQGFPPIELPNARSNPSKCWHMFAKYCEQWAGDEELKCIEFPLWCFVVCYVWHRNVSEIADFAKDLILRRDCLRDGVLHLDPSFRFFDQVSPLPYSKSLLDSPYSTMATGDELSQARDVHLSSFEKNSQGDFEQKPVYQNAVQREFFEVIRMLQRDDGLGLLSIGDEMEDAITGEVQVIDEEYLRVFPNRHPWADLSRGEIVEDETWDYPTRTWSDPHLYDVDACKAVWEMYAQSRSQIMEADSTQLLTGDMPWRSKRETASEPFVDMKALAELVGRAIETVVSTGAASRIELLQSAYETIFRRCSTATDAVLIAKGIPEKHIPKLRNP